MPPKPKHGLNANEIKYALTKLFPSPDWLSAEEVYIEGFKRFIDFWAIKVGLDKPGGPYPKKGFEHLAIHAVEVKVDRGDFLNELKTPQKRIGAELFSNYFSFAAPKGIIELDEIPEGIGYIEIQGMKPKIIRLADYKRAEPPDWAVVASIGRALQR